MEPTLIQTKLQRPYMREKLVQRHRLVQQLNENSERKLTLVLASAGYGKTTLVTSWLENQDNEVCWVSLAENDNDPVQFWLYVIAALQTVSPEVGQTALPILRNSSTTAVSVLVNDIDTHCPPDKPFILVLDDYHEISEPSIHQDLIFLLTHSPPCLRVVITSRVDPPFPLPRWRVRGLMSEIRDADLRFTEAEATVFLNQVMGLNLTTEDVTALEKRTEGWVASLKLAGLAMQSPTVLPQDRHDFVANFTGSDRYIVDYLLEEVLHQQSPHIQEFLLETAVLDRLCASLCDDILTDNTQSSASVLAYLEQANLFLTPLDNKRQWYRYHHLFADLLRYRLQETYPKRTAVLHQRAANWFEQQGLQEEAINHALAAENFDVAARLIIHLAHHLFAEGKMMVLQNWIGKLPDAFIYQQQKLFLFTGLVVDANGTI